MSDGHDTLSISARRAFLHHLIDDAGLFPPAALPMGEAIAVDRAARESPESWMLGRFIVPAGRIGELLAAAQGMEPLRLSVILDPARSAADLELVIEQAHGAAGALFVESVEVKIPDVLDGDVRQAVSCLVADIDASALRIGTPAYLELGFGPDWREHVATTLDALADARARSPHDIAAKLRCGGLSADAVPSPEQLAFAIGTLRALDVPFKATAGLHHPIRHRDRNAGFTVHGFLNVIGAAVLDHALDLDDRTRRRILSDEVAANFGLDDAAFTWCDLRADVQHIISARRRFVRSYGSCSFSEPVEDLVALGILQGAHA